MPLLRRAFPFMSLSLALLAAPGTLSAQAGRTASKSADIGVFGGYVKADPAYGPDNVNGGMVGVDFIHYFHLPVVPELEFRGNFISGTYVSEHSYLLGIKAAVPLGRLRPYGDFLVGPGNIHFPLNIGYVGDNSIVYNYGGGIDLGLTRSFALKLDVQGQHWNTGEFRYTPTLGAVGIQYTIPFRPHVSQRDLGR